MWQDKELKSIFLFNKKDINLKSTKINNNMNNQQKRINVRWRNNKKKIIIKTYKNNIKEIDEEQKSK